MCVCVCLVCYLPSFGFGTVGEVNEKLELLLWFPLGKHPPAAGVEAVGVLALKCEFRLLLACAANVWAACVKEAIVVGGKENAELIGEDNTFAPKAAACAAAYS